MRSCGDILRDGSVDELQELVNRLVTHGVNGWVAARLVEIAFWSHRAKSDSPATRIMYQFKVSALTRLCELLHAMGIDPGRSFGWVRDAGTVLRGKASFVYVVELPPGVAAFHYKARLAGPDFIGKRRARDHAGQNVRVISAYVHGVLEHRFLDKPMASASKTLP